MLRGVRALVFLLLGAVLCVVAVPQTDIPETPYDESDAPVNLALPVLPSVTFVRPPAAPVILPERVCETGRGVRYQSLERKSAYPLVRRGAHSVQNLFCTFLI